MSESPKPPQRSSLGLLVLWQLFREPMHVYRMQKLFEAEGKDRVVNVRSRASLYQTIERLQRRGLVEVAQTVHQEGYPDRVMYAITDDGRDTARVWLREMLSETGGEYPEFIVALSLLFGLPVDEARAQLELRVGRLAAQLADSKRSIEQAPPGLPRLFLLEEDYRAALLETEVTWLRRLLDDIQAGRITWSEEWLLELFETFLPPDDQPNQE